MCTILSHSMVRYSIVLFLTAFYPRLHVRLPFPAWWMDRGFLETNSKLLHLQWWSWYRLITGSFPLNSEKFWCTDPYWLISLLLNSFMDCFITWLTGSDFWLIKWSFTRLYVISNNYSLSIYWFIEWLISSMTGLLLTSFCLRTSRQDDWLVASLRRLIDLVNQHTCLNTCLVRTLLDSHQFYIHFHPRIFAVVAGLWSCSRH